MQMIRIYLLHMLPCNLITVVHDVTFTSSVCVCVCVCVCVYVCVRASIAEFQSLRHLSQQHYDWFIYSGFSGSVLVPIAHCTLQSIT